MTDSYSDHSYWNAIARPSAFPALAADLDVDVAIIGGGIVGISAARFMKDRGLAVAVVEARSVGRQATGRSTAKVTTQHGMIYAHLVDAFGKDRARLYAEAQQAGLEAVRRFVADDGIACDLKSQSAYAYTREENRAAALEAEAGAARDLGLRAEIVRETGLPFAVKAALRFDDQAQFNPTDYVAGLARTVAGEGCHVFENSRVTDWAPDHVSTAGGTIRARHVVMATHLPLGQTGLFYSRAYPHAEPVIAAPIVNAPDGMFLGLDEPGHSLRTHRRADGRIFAIAAGPRFKPGHGDEARRNFQEIEGWLADHFEVGPVEYRWINQDYRAMDDAPFVGWSSSAGDSYLVATGFHAWGLTNGTAAGMMLADLASGADNPWLDLFDARRVKLIEGGGTFLKENAHVASHLARGYIARKPDTLEAVAPGEAAVLTIDGEDLAVFRDEEGGIHAVAAACSHMGCILGWNPVDRTWDCPCHGSRFGFDGEVLHGPAVAPLSRAVDLA